MSGGFFSLDSKPETEHELFVLFWLKVWLQMFAGLMSKCNVYVVVKKKLRNTFHSFDNHRVKNVAGGFITDWNDEENCKLQKCRRAKLIKICMKFAALTLPHFTFNISSQAINVRKQMLMQFQRSMNFTLDLPI